MVNRFLYTAALYLTAPLVLPGYGLRNVVSGRGAGGVWPRLAWGLAPLPAGAPVVWLHAVSVGETLALLPLAAKLRATGRVRSVVSSVTLTGHALAKARLAADRHFYFPLDYPGACRRALAAIAPRAVLYAETELWPNFIAAAAARGVKQALVNGRISDRSFAGYRRFRSLFRPTLAQLDLLAMQTDLDAERVVALGARPDRVRVTGNLKFDALREVAAGAPHPLTDGADYWVAASTHPGEEEAVLAAQRSLPARGVPPGTAACRAGREDQARGVPPGTAACRAGRDDQARGVPPGTAACRAGRDDRERGRLVLCPRHPRRGDEVAGLVRAAGLTVQKLSDGGPWTAEVLVIDTVGVLASFYPRAQAVFLGGSLVPHGGQNMLEPAACGVPVLYGPHTFNFREAVALLDGQGGLTVADGAALGAALARFRLDEAHRTGVGGRVRAAVLARGGAADKIIALIREWF